MTSFVAALYEYFAAAFTGAYISSKITEIDKNGEIWVDLTYPNSPFDLLCELFDGYKAIQVLLFMFPYHRFIPRCCLPKISLITKYLSKKAQPQTIQRRHQMLIITVLPLEFI